MNTLPPSACAIDGTPRGHTPFAVSVTVGIHELHCVAGDGVGGLLHKWIKVTIRTGQQTNAVLKMRD